MNLDDNNYKRLTLESYVTDPSQMTGAIMNMSLVRKAMQDKYKEAILKHKKFDTTVYYNEHKMYITVDIPSDSYKLSYQVMIEMQYNDKKDYIDDKDIRIFSNCPSFVYTYAYVYNLSGHIIPELKEKYSKEVLTQQPIQKNYFKIMSFEKSLFFAFTYLLENFKTIDDLLRNAKHLKRYDPFDNIMTDKQIIELYDKKRREYNKLKKENVVVALADKIKKDNKKKSDAQRKIISSNPEGHLNTTNRTKIQGKSKVTGKSKITGKAKITGKSKRR